jgi:AraC family transcriptional regulator
MSSAEHIPTVRMNEAIRRLPSMDALVSNEDRGWVEVSLLLFRGGLPTFHRWVCPDTLVVFLLDGEPFVEWKQGATVLGRRCEPGEITILAGEREQVMRCDGSPLAMIWTISPSRLREFAEQEFGWSGDRIDVRESLGEDDPVLRLLGEDLTTELRSPCPFGRLRAENLQQRLLAQLLLRHSSLRRGVEVPHTALTRRRLFTALDFIEGSLGEEDLTLKRIAGEAGLSEFCFARSFREEMGLPPHRYVLERRVARARQMLHEPGRSIAEVAYAVGFSSQSHLTTVFRGQVGLTPGDYRKAM